MNEIDKLLTKGLQSGYAGKTERGKSNRGPFVVETSQSEIDGGVYRDEWIAGERTGGGQELVVLADGRKFTRIYGGGMLDQETMDECGITAANVTDYLKTKIQELGEKTRLDRDLEFQTDGNWGYEYRVIDLSASYGKIPLTMGIESIKYKHALIFAHGFILTTVK